jgi:hypothetical protein
MRKVKPRIMHLLRRKPRTCAAVAVNLGVTPSYAWQYLNRYVRELALVKYTDTEGDIVYAVPTEPVIKVCPYP